jgi:hypothetical protein
LLQAIPQKMAALVAEGAESISGVDVRVCDVDVATAEGVHWCDGLAVGSLTYMGIPSRKMQRFWDELMAPHWMKVDGKIACAFSSSVGWGGGSELACQSILTVLMNFGDKSVPPRGSPAQPAWPGVTNEIREAVMDELAVWNLHGFFKSACVENACDTAPAGTGARRAKSSRQHKFKGNWDRQFPAELQR